MGEKTSCFDASGTSPVLAESDQYDYAPETGRRFVQPGPTAQARQNRAAGVEETSAAMLEQMPQDPKAT